MLSLGGKKRRGGWEQLRSLSTSAAASVTYVCMEALQRTDTWFQWRRKGVAKVTPEEEGRDHVIATINTSH